MEYAGKSSTANRVLSLSIPGKIESFSLKNRHALIADDILSPLLARPRRRERSAGDFDLLLSIDAGDCVVHADHGIGIYAGRAMRSVDAVQREYIEIRYADGDTLRIPVEEAYRLTKYVGRESPALSRLGGKEWKKHYESAERDAEEVAKHILENHARRQVQTGFSHVPFVQKEREFRAAFHAPHTQGQARAIDEVLSDMKSPAPMDRLLSGDVGFGKTEVAMNAIYRAHLNGKQTIFLSPLVVLASDHYDTACERLSPFGMRVATLTRLTSNSEAKRILK